MIEEQKESRFLEMIDTLIKNFSNDTSQILDHEEFKNLFEAPEFIEEKIKNFVKEWNVEKSLYSALQYLDAPENQEDTGERIYYSEKDLQYTLYYLLKYSKGSKVAEQKNIEELGILLTFSKNTDDIPAYALEYLSKNSEMFDFHMYFFLSELYKPFDYALLKKTKFRLKTVFLFSFLIKTKQFPVIFTFRDIRKLRLPKHIYIEMVELVKFLKLDIKVEMLSELRLIF